MTKRLSDLADELQVTEFLLRQLSDVEQSLKWLHLEKADSQVVAEPRQLTTVPSNQHHRQPA